ncbi:MAG: hypothetical protein ACJA01_000682 [Saprospiraceae bacterium]|jgi:hypothetical protein
MKKIIYSLSLLFIIGFMFNSCESPLEETVFSELSPDNFLKTKEGINSLLYNAYSNVQITAIPAYILLNVAGMPSGETWGRGGSIETRLTPLTNFTWDSNHGDLGGEWDRQYRAIRDANLLLDNLTDTEFDAEFVKDITAEAKFIRAKAMMQIWDWFGAGPLFISSVNEELKKTKASDEEWVAQIITDMTEAMNGLPATQSQYGRPTSGACAGLLCKFFLNEKRWSEALAMADNVINSGLYGLFPTYLDLFSIANEANEEMVYVHPSSRNSGGGSNRVNALTFPTDYPRTSNQGVWAARVYLYDSFVDTYEGDDSRLDMLVRSYVSTATGEVVNGYGNDQTLPLKYQYDPDALGTATDSDVPEVRYADVLLSKAEAMNELNGPSQAVIDLINQVKARAGALFLNLADYDKNSLRDALLAERSWELAYEGKSRQDQIRHGVFISRAQARGKNAQDFHKKFPIPQRELDANENMTQNPGY